MLLLLKLCEAIVMREGDLMTVGEFAALVRKTPAAVYQMNHRRTGPRYLKIGKSVLYRREDVTAWLTGRYARTDAA